MTSKPNLRDFRNIAEDPAVQWAQATKQSEMASSKKSTAYAMRKLKGKETSYSLSVYTVWWRRSARELPMDPVRRMWVPSEILPAEEETISQCLGGEETYHFSHDTLPD